MGDDITIGVTEIVNNIEVTAQPNDQVIDIEVIDNSDDVTLNVTPNVIEVNINKGSSYARWGSISGNLTDQTDLTNALFNKADLVDGKVPAYQLPSFVDDVIEVANFAALPTVGEIGKIYVTLDNNKIYRWSGSIYIEIASNQAIWGSITGTLSNQTDLVNALNTKQNTLVSGTNIKTLEGQSLLGSGNIDLSKSDVGLGNVDNTSDLNKPVSTATQTALNLKANDNAVVKLTGGTLTGSLFGTSATFAQSSAADTLYGYNGKIGGTGISGGAANGLAGYFANNSTTYPVTRIVGLSNTNLIEGLNTSGTATFTVSSAGNVTANSFIKSGGTSSQYLMADGSVSTLTNPITGTGTTNYLPKFTGASTLGNSQIFDNGTNVGIGTTSPAVALDFGNVTGKAFHLYTSGVDCYGLNMAQYDGSAFSTNIFSGDGGLIKFRTASGTSTQSTRMTINAVGNVGIGTLSPIDFGSTFKILNTSGSTGSFVLASNSTNSIIGQMGVDDTLVYYGSRTNHPVSFSTNTFERMRITSGGNVGIGTTSPAVRLDVLGSSEVLRLRSNATANYFTFFNSSNSQIGDIGYDGRDTDILSIWNGLNGGILFGTNASERMRITAGGSVVVNNLGTGLVYSNAGALTSTNPSDERLKDDITDLKYGLNEILQLRPVSYNWKNDTINQGKQFGFIAQEVQEIMPDLISEFNTIEDEEEVVRLGLDKEGIYATLVNAIKELKAEIEILKNK
jgi:hypothetical protein